MSREETSLVLEEIWVTSRALVEIGEPDAGDPPSRLCEELRNRRRALLARLSENRR